MRYEEMSLDELYKEAFHTDNELALHLFSHIDEAESRGYDAGWDDCELACRVSVVKEMQR